MRVYLAGPMTGIPYFNFPAFMQAARKLRLDGSTVFNPAERDIERHGTDVSVGNPTGDPKQAAKEHGLTLRVALHDDLVWICKEATHIALLPGWEQSSGCRVEHALATALKLGFIYLPHPHKQEQQFQNVPSDADAHSRQCPMTSVICHACPPGETCRAQYTGSRAPDWVKAQINVQPMYHTEYKKPERPYITGFDNR